MRRRIILCPIGLPLGETLQWSIMLYGVAPRLLSLSGLDNDGLDVLVRELEGGRFARSAAAPRASLLKTWSRFHKAAFGEAPGAIPEYPITVRTFVAVAA